MKKFAFIINVFRENNFHSGGEKLFYKLINKCIESNYTVDLYCSKYIGKSDTPDLAGINNITVIGQSYYYKDPVVMEKLFQEIKEHIDKNNYDMVITDSMAPPVDMAFFQGHSLAHRYKLESFFDSILLKLKKSNHFKYQKKWLKQGFRHIFTVSNVLKQDIVDNFNINPEKISVVYPGVDIPEENINPDFSLIIEGKRPLIFGISAPSFKYKGGNIFLKSLKTLKDRGYNFKAKIIYSKYNKNLYLKTVIKLYGLENNVEFLPYQGNMQDFYNSIDCLAVPSIVETFGLVVLEAMAHKKPCIVGSYAGASEIIQDGVNGFTFNMKEKSSYNLTDKMAFILDNPDKLDEYSESAFETAKTYSWNKTCNDFLTEVSRVIE
ncbi:MAG: glycosyl transferase group 1 [uncultured bacterium]|nr:MAG: glycosyl transferase group 1 [uncultured bacterium]